LQTIVLNAQTTCSSQTGNEGDALAQTTSRAVCSPAQAVSTAAQGGDALANRMHLSQHGEIVDGAALPSTPLFVTPHRLHEAPEAGGQATEDKKTEMLELIIAKLKEEVVASRDCLSAQKVAPPLLSLLGR